jgi:hypothetical protein
VFQKRRVQYEISGSEKGLHFHSVVVGVVGRVNSILMTAELLNMKALETFGVGD